MDRDLAAETDFYADADIDYDDFDSYESDDYVFDDEDEWEPIPDSYYDSADAKLGY